MPWLINPIQLDKFRKSQKNVVILDASWYLPTENRHAYNEYVEAHIPGARHFDITAFNDPNTSLPNMLTRDESVIADQLGALGITNEHKIIFYDNSPLHSSCRALWMMKVFGHNPFQLYVLDGGLAAWKNFDSKIESGEARPAASKSYQVNYNSHLIRTLVQMKSNLHHPKEQVVDMRHPVRFAGGKDRYHANVRPGHIPGSFSFPFTTMFDIDGKLKSLDRIRKLITGIGVDLSCPIVTMCGSGVTSATLNFALDLLDITHHTLYDGSWSEWGAEGLYAGEDSLAERPVVTSLDAG